MLVRGCALPCVKLKEKCVRMRVCVFAGDGRWYLMQGSGCCFCWAGDDANMFESTTGPYGPYTSQASHKRPFSVSAQYPHEKRDELPRQGSGRRSGRTKRKLRKPDGVSVSLSERHHQLLKQGSSRLPRARCNLQPDLRWAGSRRPGSTTAVRRRRAGTRPRSSAIRRFQHPVGGQWHCLSLRRDPLWLRAGPDQVPRVSVLVRSHIDTHRSLPTCTVCIPVAVHTVCVYARLLPVATCIAVRV